ncbi:MAG: hypothetical protein WC565_10635, partial [Parcubacteria group bacterium]
RTVVIIPRELAGGGMWTISYGRRLLSVIEVGQPYESGGRFCIDIVTETGERVVSKYTMAWSADQAYQKFREYAVRGGVSDKNSRLFIWPIDLRADELSPAALQEIARLTE